MEFQKKVEECSVGGYCGGADFFNPDVLVGVNNDCDIVEMHIYRGIDARIPPGMMASSFIKPDGNCGFRAIAHCFFNDQESHPHIREAACWIIRDKAQSFLGKVEGLNSTGTVVNENLSVCEYLAAKILVAEHAGQVERWIDENLLEASAYAYSCQIRIFTVYNNEPVLLVLDPVNATSGKSLSLVHTGSHYEVLTNKIHSPSASMISTSPITPVVDYKKNVLSASLSKGNLFLGTPPITPPSNDTPAGHQSGQPFRTLYTKPIKIRNVAGNKDIFAGESGIPVNVDEVDCSPDDCSVTPNVDEAGVLVSFDLRVCAFERIMTPKKMKIVEKNRNAIIKAGGSHCVGFTIVVVLNGGSYKFNIPCPHSTKLSVETGVFARTTGYFNGIDFLCEKLKNDIVVNPVTLEKIKVDPIANLSKDAYNFRANHKFVSRKPTPLAGKTFIYRLIRLGAAGERFIIRNTADVHVEFTPEELKEHQDWLLANLGNIRGTETNRILKFVSGSGIDMFSANRRFPELDADAVGQEWESDGYGWNLMQKEFSRSELLDFISELRLCNFQLGDLVWNSYVSGTQPPSILSPSERNSLTAAITTIWEGQEESRQMSWRLAWRPNSVIVPHERVWKKAELMEQYFVGRLGGIYPTTGTIMKPEDVACDRTLSKDKYNEPTTLPLQRKLNHMRQAAVNVFADEDTVAAELERRGMPSTTDPRWLSIVIVREFIVSVVNNHGGFINESMNRIYGIPQQASDAVVVISDDEQ
ncbi:hypothetical protein HK100_000595 [Physocladia obscura]|uniref:OTU domain-containing protein n=1 Tax=Physocladia obscura TaxID=109957 RepID=A0AAD5TAI9_9FUNG|nr:hypothetical protein HK100_000595 [Physocladia obscura]